MKRKSFYIYLAIYFTLNLIIYQVHIVYTYLESLLDDNKYLIFMKLPLKMHELWQIRKRLLYKLLRSLYDLGQFGRLWNKNVIVFYKSIDFRQLNGNPNILIWQAKNETSVVSIYVDDFLLVSNTMNVMQTLKDVLEIKYKMKNLGKVNMIIKWQITRDTAMRIMKINHSAFIKDLVIKKRLEECNANVIPMKAGSIIEMLNFKDYDKTDLHKYQRLIGKLLYLSCKTRSNIALTIGQLSRHNVDPQKGHLRSAKRIVRYLKETM